MQTKWVSATDSTDVARLARHRLGALHKALIGSFAIYVVPLVGPHAVWLLGEHLLHEMTRAPADHPLAWTALDVALTIAAQGLLAGLLYPLFARPSVARLVLVTVGAAWLWPTLEWAYLAAIPERFLIEADPSAERLDWPLECFVADVTLAMVRTPPDLPLERAGRAWVSGSDGRSYGMLENCRLIPMPTAASPPMTVPFVLADGRSLQATWERASGQNRWLYSGGSDAPATPLRRPPADPNRSVPILSDDGEWTAWIEFVAGETTTPLPEQVTIRSLRDERERIVRLPDPGGSSRVLAGIDLTTQTITLVETEYATLRSGFVRRGFDGAVRAEPLIARDVAAQATTMLEVGDGWLAWDAYRDAGRYRVAWNLTGGSGRHEVPLGRGITAADVDPRGSYVALSTTTTLNIGQIRDSVYVLRARDGGEAFRRYLPMYSRSRVAFLGDSRLAYDDQEGGRFGVRVLRVPSDSSTSAR